jgi:ABC-2 type transport system permease protein
MADQQPETKKPKSAGAKRAQYGAYLSLYTLIVIAVIVVANWLANDNNKNFDLTTNKQFTLSEQTDKTVHNLKNDVYLTYFDNAQNFQTARDLLERYGNLSHKLHVAYVDPEKQPEIARAQGFRSEGSVIVRAGTKTEEAPSLSEETVTNAIIRVLKTDQKTVCFVTGSGESATDDAERSGSSIAKENLEKGTYKTQTVNLLVNPQISPDCAALIIAGPKRDYVDAEVASIKAYVEGGGHALFSLSPVIPSARPTPDQNQATPNINKLVGGWGITPAGNIVIDPRSAISGFSEAAPLGVKYESQPIVRDLGGVATLFPLAQSLNVTSPAEKLISSSESSLAVTKIGPGGEIDQNAATKGPLVLAAVDSIGSGAKQGRVVVVGSAIWMSNQGLGITQVGNRDLFMNMVNWLTADEDLISIRPKEPEDRRITMTVPQIRMVTGTVLIFLPLLCIAAGVASWLKRR